MKKTKNQKKFIKKLNDPALSFSDYFQMYIDPKTTSDQKVNIYNKIMSDPNSTSEQRKELDTVFIEKEHRDIIHYVLHVGGSFDEICSTGKWEYCDGILNIQTCHMGLDYDLRLQKNKVIDAINKYINLLKKRFKAASYYEELDFKDIKDIKVTLIFPCPDLKCNWCCITPTKPECTCSAKDEGRPCGTVDETDKNNWNV